MIYPIVKFGNPVLETKAADVTEFGDELKKLVDDQLTVPVFTPDGRFISQDCRHLTRAGARYFATLFDTEIRAMMAAAREASAKRLSSTGQPN